MHHNTNANFLAITLFLIACNIHLLRTVNKHAKLNLHSLTDLYDTGLIQLDLPFLVFEVFAYVISYGGGLQHKPALSPVPAYVPLFPHVALRRTEKWHMNDKKADKVATKSRDVQTKVSHSSGHCGTSPERLRSTPDWRPLHWWPSAADVHPYSPRRSRPTCPLLVLQHLGIVNPQRVSHPTPDSLLCRFSWVDTPPKSRKHLQWSSNIGSEYQTGDKEFIFWY